MARIRTVKPEFFRHEGLQDLEIAHPGQYPMMVFEGLWGHCDKAGRFEWKPRTLKLDILPFLPFDMADTLEILAAAGFVRRYTVGGKEYGQIDTFTEHQRLGGKEAQEPSRFPAPDSSTDQSLTEQMATGKQRGSNGEATGKQLGLQEGKGRERKGKEEKACASSDDDAPTRSEPIPFQHIADAFNRTMGRLPKVREITTKRKTLIRSAWQASPQRRTKDFWDAYFEECADDPFLSGVGPYRNGHENWRPDFDYLLRAEVVTRVFEKAMHRMERPE